MKPVKLFEEFVNAVYIDSTEVPIRLGNKVELKNGQQGVILKIKNEHSVLILLDNGVTAEVDPNEEISVLVADTEPTKGNKPFIN